MNAISLTVLATEINNHHHQAQQAARNAISHALSAGEALLIAKSTVSHGQWITWIGENTAIPERTAQHYMRLAKNRSQLESKTASVADLKVTEAVKLIADQQPPEFLPQPGQMAINSFRFGEARKVALIGDSRKHRGYFYYGLLIFPDGYEKGWFEGGNKPIHADALKGIIDYWLIPEDSDWIHGPFDGLAEPIWLEREAA